jgi:hypothetical protein
MRALQLPLFNAHADGDGSWITDEVLGCEFRDRRLGRRFKIVLKQLSEASCESIPLACQDWANAKAAYRFFDNDRVSEADILSGHIRSTRQRFAGAAGTVLILHDTREFSYMRENVGLLHKPKHGPSHPWRRKNPLCGISMHSSLAVTEGGLPLGLAAVRFWTRKEFKGTNALRGKINMTRGPIGEKESNRWVENLVDTTAALGEPNRCVHIGDRAADIYELFCAANDVGTHFLVRTCVSRVARDGTTRTDCVIESSEVKGLHRIEVRDRDDEFSEAVLEIKYERMLVLPPDAKAKDYGPLTLTAIHAREKGARKNRDRIDWKLLTDLPVRSREGAIEKLRWYAQRWKVELFHKILKSGCKVEESLLRTAPRLVNLIATCCVLGWRIFWMTMMNRTNPSASPTVALTQLELELLDRLRDGAAAPAPALSDYIGRIARLGGYLARASDPPPGNIVMWRGLARLTDMAIGFSLNAEKCG